MHGSLQDQGRGDLQIVNAHNGRHAMKQTFILILTALSLTIVRAQEPLWNFKPNIQDYIAVGSDTTAEKLKAMMREDPPSKYFAPALILAYRYKDSERAFLIDSMRIYASQDQAVFPLTRYFRYHLILGYLGKAEAISGMDTVARMMPMDYDRLKAIELLAERGHFDYFNVLEDASSEKKYAPIVLEGLALYLQNPPSRDQTRNLLSSLISDSTKTTYMTLEAAVVLAKVDSPSAQSLLIDRFKHANSSDKRGIFLGISLFNRDLQPQLSMEAISSESDEVRRESYYPLYGAIVGDSTSPGFQSKGYLKPSFIKFALDRLDVESSHATKGLIEIFYTSYVPADLNQPMTLVDRLDSLIATEEEVSGYGWVPDTSLKLRLDSILTRARNFVVTGDSTNCFRQITRYQAEVDSTYRANLGSGKQGITIDGWKFLHYGAQYCLNRLPLPR